MPRALACAMVEVKRRRVEGKTVRYVECPHCEHLLILLDGVFASDAAAEAHLRKEMEAHVAREHG